LRRLRRRMTEKKWENGTIRRSKFRKTRKNPIGKKGRGETIALTGEAKESRKTKPSRLKAACVGKGGKLSWLVVREGQAEA